MAVNSMTAVDVYQLMNSIVSQATGRSDLVATDTSSFVTVGETVLRTGTENVLNAISQTLSKTIFSIRPYKAKLQILRANEQRWGGITRKITYLYNEAEASEDYNTDINPNQIDDGNSVDMYKIKKPQAIQLNFYGTKKLQKHITRFRDQIAQAFSSESEFTSFIDGVMTEFFNEVEMINEAKARAVLVNYIGGLFDMGQVIDVVKEFNKQNGTQYTREELKSQAHLEEYMKFIASFIKIMSKKFTDNTSKYHANLTGKNVILRHTPENKQRMIMYDPLFIRSKAEVYSSIFNPEYLNIGEFEGVNYWQSNTDGKEQRVSVTPNILNVADGSAKKGAKADISNVLGILYDEEAIGVIPQFDYSSTTPFNSAGGYYNMFMHWRFNTFTDYTENGILFIEGDGGPTE